MYPGHVDRFVDSIVEYLNQKGFDGVDIDWEYPGVSHPPAEKPVQLILMTEKEIYMQQAPDIRGIPAGLKSDGPNYLTFLEKLRAKLPRVKTLSIAAPASYWYLKSFPIVAMAKLVDYIVYMTYDLHGMYMLLNVGCQFRAFARCCESNVVLILTLGQWDYDNHWSQDGCLSGNCLRSHGQLLFSPFTTALHWSRIVTTSNIHIVF